MNSPQSSRLNKSQTAKIFISPNVMPQSTNNRTFIPVVLRTKEGESNPQLLEIKKAGLVHYVLLAAVIIGVVYYVDNKLKENS